jgi:anti-sigma factor RsiW
MNCTGFIEAFSDYCDGSGTPTFRDDAEVHLASCCSCRRYLEVYERGRSLLRSFPDVQVSDDFHPRLQHRIYHVDDEGALAPGGHMGSATTAATALGMALLVVAAAWSPAVLLRERVVELAPIVVTQPASRRPQVRPLGSGLIPLSGPTSMQESWLDLWSRSNDLLFQSSPLYNRTRPSLIRRTGLD